jgi:subtilase family serine protease
MTLPDKNVLMDQIALFQRWYSRTADHWPGASAELMICLGFRNCGGLKILTGGRFESRRFFWGAMAILLAVHSRSVAQTRALITQPINESNLVTLLGNTHPLAQPGGDRGPVPDDTPMDGVWLLLKRPPAQEKAFLDFLGQQQDRNSPNYHKWLTAEQIGQRFGPSPEDIATVSQWLESFGFKINAVYPHGTLIDFSGVAGQIRRAFHTEMHFFDVEGVRHFANVSDPRIPVALEPVLAGPVALHNFLPRHTHVKKTTAMAPAYANSTGQQLVPGDLATIYNLNPAFTAGYTGSGVTIAVLEQSDVYTTADWGVFRKEFGLAKQYPSGTFTQIHPGNCRGPGVTSDDVESILDAEWASAAAPNAAVVLASCRNGVITALQNLLSFGPIPAVVSISYSEEESELGNAGNAAVNSVYQHAAAAGVSVFISAGDWGAAAGDGADSEKAAVNGIQVNGLATTPYNVAVGGTDFGDVVNNASGEYWSSANATYFNSALSYIQEIPWNSSCASLLLATYKGITPTYGSTGFCNSSAGAKYLDVVAGGGGASVYQTSKPAFQDGFAGNPADGTRDIPDVSLFAANGIWGHYYLVCYSDTTNSGESCTGAPSTWFGAGGTSFAAPIMAGIMALVVQKNGAEGNPLSEIYTIAGSNYGGASLAQCNSSNGTSAASSCIFYDVTQGDTDVPCTGTLNCYLPSGTYGVLSISNSAYQPAYSTRTGWDFATGIGTLNGYNFLIAY